MGHDTSEAVADARRRVEVLLTGRADSALASLRVIPVALGGMKEVTS